VRRTSCPRAGGLFKKHGQHTTDASFIELAFCLASKKPAGGEPLGLTRSATWPAADAGGGAGPRRILEKKRLSKADLFDRSSVAWKSSSLYPPEADDQIGRKSEIGTPSVGAR